MTRKEMMEYGKDAIWALLFAAVLWQLADRNVRETRSKIPVQIRVEAQGYRVHYIETGGTVAPEVLISISAPRIALDRFSTQGPLEAVYRFSEVSESDLGKEIPIPTDQFRLDLPPDIEVVSGSYEPKVIRIELRKETRKRFEIEAQTRNLPESWTVTVDEVVPTFVEATGPEDAIDAIARLKTEPIDVLGWLGRNREWSPTRAEPLSLRGLPVEVATPSGSGIQTELQRVRVSLTVSPREEERELQVIPTIAVEPPWTDYKLRGNPSKPVRIKLRGPKALLSDERLLRQRIQVFAVCTKAQINGVDPKERNLKPDRLLKLYVEVHAPDLTVLEHDEFYEVEVNEVRKVDKVGGEGG